MFASKALEFVAIIYNETHSQGATPHVAGRVRVLISEAFWPREKLWKKGKVSSAYGSGNENWKRDKEMTAKVDALREAFDETLQKNLIILSLLSLFFFQINKKRLLNFYYNQLLSNLSILQKISLE